MGAKTNAESDATPEPLFCLHCMKLLILAPGLVMEVDDHTGVFIGYLHKSCAENWKLMNPTCTVELIATK
jgi:hypothetical protein